MRPEDFCEAIHANPSDSTVRKVFADYLEESNSFELARFVRIGKVGTRYGGGGYGYGGEGGGSGGEGSGSGGGGGDGGGGGGGKINATIFSEGLLMRDGLCIISVPSGYYPLVRVGWCRREDLFVSLKNCRVIRWFGTNAQIAQLAKIGPMDSTVLLDPSEEEFASVVECGRVVPCNPDAWAAYCPKPEGWDEG